MKRSLLAMLGAAGFALSACSSGADASGPAASVVPVAEALPAAEVDATISVVGGDGQVMSWAEVEELGMTELAIFEPFIEEDTVFQGPLLSEVFAALGIVEGSVEVLAVNEYGFTADVAEWPIDAVLATRERGEPIPGESGGPFRVVFPDDSEWVDNFDAWVWSVDRFVID